MDMQLKQEFIRLWGKYYNNAPLPLVFYYADEAPQSVTTVNCLVAPLTKARKGNTVVFSADSVKCFGGRQYLGFSQRPTEALSDQFEYTYLEYFLSSGIPGQIEGERYKKSPALCREVFQRAPEFRAPAGYCVFKRWDMLDEKETPEVVVFFVKPDVLSGLFTLANYDTVDSNAVIIPWGSGCSSIITAPYLEKDAPHPRAVAGMLDISARPFVARDELTFSVPMNRFTEMLGHIEESFHITKDWQRIQKRITAE